MSKDSIFIKFTRDSNFNNLPGVGFQPNHFVPAILVHENKGKHFVIDKDDFPPLSGNAISTLKKGEAKTDAKRYVVSFA